MERKYLVLLFMSIVLIGTLGFLSAEDVNDSSTSNVDVLEAVDDSNDVEQSTDTNDGENTNYVESTEKVDVMVKMVWEDNNNPKRPKSVNVDIIKDGKVVKSIVLSSENQWAETVNLDKSDDYSVQVDPIDGYKDPVVSKISGTEFKITASIKESLSKSNTQNIVQDGENTNGKGDTPDNGPAGNNQNNGTDDKPDNNNQNDNNTPIVISTQNNNTNTTNSTGNANVSSNDTNKTPNQIFVKKPVKKAPVQNQKVTKNETQKKIIRTVGNPIFLLLVALGLVGVGTYLRRRN